MMIITYTRRFGMSETITFLTSRSPSLIAQPRRLEGLWIEASKFRLDHLLRSNPESHARTGDPGQLGTPVVCDIHWEKGIRVSRSIPYMHPRASALFVHSAPSPVVVYKPRNQSSRIISPAIDPPPKMQVYPSAYR